MDPDPYPDPYWSPASTSGSGSVKMNTDPKHWLCIDFAIRDPGPDPDTMEMGKRTLEQNFKTAIL